MKKKVSGSTAVVLGRSKIVGTPAAGDYYDLNIQIFGKSY